MQRKINIGLLMLITTVSIASSALEIVDCKIENAVVAAAEPVDAYSDGEFASVGYDEFSFYPTGYSKQTCDNLKIAGTLIDSVQIVIPPLLGVACAASPDPVTKGLVLALGIETATVGIIRYVISIAEDECALTDRDQLKTEIKESIIIDLKKRGVIVK